MSIKLAKNQMHNLTAKISKDTNDKIDISLERIKNETGIELKKNEWIEHLLNYALENAVVEVENTDIKIQVKDYIYNIEKDTEDNKFETEI